MRNFRPASFLVILISVGLINSPFAQTVSTTGKNSPAVGIVKRDMVVNNVSHVTNKNINNYNVSVSTQDTSKLNVLEQHQDALLIATNPTQIEIVGASFLEWAGDKEEYLSLTFKNLSKLPALKFSFGIIDKNSVNDKISNVKFSKFRESASSSKNLNMEYQIGAGKEHMTPFISISELSKLISLKPSDCVVWAGLQNSENKSPNFRYKQGNYSSLTYSVPVAFTYKSIFNEYFLIRTGVFVTVTQRDALEQPGSSSSDGENRCHGTAS